MLFLGAGTGNWSDESLAETNEGSSAKTKINFKLLILIKQSVENKPILHFKWKHATKNFEMFNMCK